jgi:hypothetical protein
LKIDDDIDAGYWILDAGYWIADKSRHPESFFVFIQYPASTFRKI